MWYLPTPAQLIPGSSSINLPIGNPVTPRGERRTVSPSDPRVARIPYIHQIHSLNVDPDCWSLCSRSLPHHEGGGVCGHIWNESLKYCFQTPAWFSINFKSVILTKVFRQTDQAWVNILSKLKVGEVTDDILQYLESLRRPLRDLDSGVKPTRLYTHRSTVERENEEEFQKLTTQQYDFDAIDEGVMNKGTKYMRQLEPHELDKYSENSLSPACRDPSSLTFTSKTSSKISRFKKK